ncbi:hypothetical protein BDP81DRAFT_442202 [Colletotrichum phormii]|uniref:Uncharacterized protein n=1 Tax=Colletotrichum phormii TaxID=359342 RepID=A0AAJ0E9V9_9PEZI|nr:uncharacterized protein BDP81DRAFT_442202 [Colletotrichum phormii]KAK1622098.1 hypothetical protein BDP81DRAFT_442202 [Colletotrichum phormii]
MEHPTAGPAQAQALLRPRSTCWPHLLLATLEKHREARSTLLADRRIQFQGGSSELLGQSTTKAFHGIGHGHCLC